MSAPLLVLASASPRRRVLAQRLGWSVRIVRSRHREPRPRPGVKPRAWAMRQAELKARKAVLPAGLRTSCVVLGVDTIVIARGRILGKPRSKKEALGMLGRLSDRTHKVATAIVLWHPGQGKILRGIAISRVRFRRLDRPAILRYIERVHTLDKAGAYALQEKPRIVASVRGSRSNVVGLPLELLRKKLTMAKKWLR